MYKETSIRLSLDFPSELMEARRQWDDVFKVQKWLLPNNSISSKNNLSEWWGKWQGCFLSLFTFNIVQEFLARAIKEDDDQEEDGKEEGGREEEDRGGGGRREEEEEEVEEKEAKYQNKLSINEQYKNKIKKKIISNNIKRIKYIAVCLTEEMQDLYTVNYKTFWKEIK